MNKKTVQFDLFELEMWGNKEDGWEQNNQFHLGKLIVPCAPDGSFTETDILKAMKKHEICPAFGRPYKALCTRDRRRVFIEDLSYCDGLHYEIGLAQTREPLYRLDLIGN